jgi:uncharacterized membrane protein
MIDVEYNRHSHQGRIVLQPNRAISWRANRIFLLLITIITTLIASGFALLGAWLILPFAGIEILLLASLLWYVYTIHSRQEVVHFSAAEVVVEKGRREPVLKWKCQRPWCRLNLYRSHPWYPQRLKLRCHQREIEIGEFLNENERDELRAYLRQFMNHD